MFNSLKFKIITVAVIILSLIMSFATWRNIMSTEEKLLNGQKEKTVLLSDRISHGIMVLMLQNKWRDLQDMMESLVKDAKELKDIKIFLPDNGVIVVSSNPCNACHNPHAAQGDPLGDGGGTTAVKNTILANRGWPVSRPSLHSTDNSSWGLWGDGAGEKMSTYASSVSGNYLAPYQYNTTSAYEPAACTSLCNGSELTDYVTFCSDCHDDSNTISSTTLSRNLYKFAWASEKHGGTDATNDGTFGGTTIDDLIAPYNESSVTDYVLACTDCHEPHGSANRFLIREGVNGGTSTTSVTLLASSTPDNTMEWKSLCSKCHDTSTDNNKAVHHRAYDQEFGASVTECAYCHEPDADDMRNCLQCHYHGSTQWPAVSDPVLGAHTYNSSEKMF